MLGYKSFIIKRIKPDTSDGEVNGKVSNIIDFRTDTEFTVGRLFLNPTLKNLAPRIGLAWDPFGDGKTAIRAGFGVFYNIQMAEIDRISNTSNPPFATRGTVLAAIIHKFGVSVDFLRKFRAESVFRCDYKASKLVEPNRDEARAPSGNSSARRGLYICVGAGSQGTVRWDTDGASVMRRAFVRDKTMPGAPRCDEKFPEPGHRF